MLLNIKQLCIESNPAPLSEDAINCMKNCIRFWNVGAERKKLKDLLEERVPEKYERFLGWIEMP